MTSLGAAGGISILWIVTPVILFGIAIALASATKTESLFAIAGFAGPFAALVGLLIIYAAITGDERAMALLIFIATFMVEAVFRKRAYTDKSIDFQVMLKVGMLAVILIPTIFIMYRTRFRSLAHIGPFWFVLYAWFAVTTAWAPNFLYSLVAVVSAASYLLFFATVSSQYDRVMVVRVILYAISLFAVASLVIYFGIPKFGRMPLYTTGLVMGESTQLTSRLTGLTGTSNAAGDISALGLLLAVIFWSRLRAIDGVLFYAALVPCVAMLLLSQSRMAIGALCLTSYFYYLATPRRASLVLLTGAAIFFIGIGLFSYEDDLLALLSRSGRANEVTSLTGRTAIWGVVLKLIAMKPLFGWGYAGATQVLSQYTGEVGFRSISQAHNMMLQLTLTTGVVGAFLFVVTLADFLLRCYVNKRRDALTLMLFVLVLGLTEPALAYGMANTLVLAFGLAIGLSAAASPKDSRSSMPQTYAASTR